jgi:hypothetical protein
MPPEWPCESTTPKTSWVPEDHGLNISRRRVSDENGLAHGMGQRPSQIALVGSNERGAGGSADRKGRHIKWWNSVRGSRIGADGKAPTRGLGGR